MRCTVLKGWASYMWLDMTSAKQQGLRSSLDERTWSGRYPSGEVEAQLSQASQGGQLAGAAPQVARQGQRCHLQAGR